MLPTRGGDETSIRPGTVSDAAGAARLHASQINEGFLSRLGPGFLKHLYRRVVRSDGSFLLVAVRNGEAAGFLAGSIDLSGLYKEFLFREGIVAAITSAPRLALAWRQTLETLGHSSRPRGHDEPFSELLSVAVDPAYQGLGIGSLLVEAFKLESSARRVAIGQVVVGRDNHRAVALYERCGFKTVEQFEMHKGTVSLLMECDNAARAKDAAPGREGG